MVLDKKSYDEVSKMLSLKGPRMELECKFKQLVTKDAFTRMIQYCRSTNMVETLQDDQLDVFCKLASSPSHIRLSLVGKDRISKYCKSNGFPDDVIAIIKKPVPGVKSIPLDELSFKVDMKEEVPLDDFAKQELIARIAVLEKGYRYKKRFSYQDKNVRYDFTIVKTSTNPSGQFLCHPGFVTSGLLSSREMYEVEIEYIDTNTTKQKKKTVLADMVNELTKAMLTIYLIYTEEPQFVSKESKREAIQNYLRLCFKEVDKEELERNPRTYFAAPQPVTLERKNMQKPDLGIVSILEDYTVTEKADGERCLLFVNNDGRCYIIDSRLNFRFTGIKLNNIVNTLVDGEYITRDLFGKRISVYGAFDIYFHNTEDVRGSPLVNGRLDKLKEVEKRFAGHEESSFKFFVKKFFHEDNIFENVKNVLDSSQTFMYKTDGLIFTPANLGVPITYGTWDKVFKYKPPEENTIDFLVKFGMLRAGEGKILQELELYVGHNPQKHNRITPMDFITGNTRQKRGYFPKRFEPADILDGSASSAFLEIGVDKHIYCLNGDEVENNSIVEFSWRNGAWIPTRVRKDKTELFQKQGLSRTANDLFTAMSVWRSIRNPVTHDMIIGKSSVPEDSDTDDAYYFRNISRDKMATKAMLDFHNIWIKNMCLIKKYSGKTLLDIACGKAGDLNKWVEAKIEKVVGIDYSRDNIENPGDGAIVRTIKKLATIQDKPKFLYLTMDGGELLGKRYFNTLENQNDKLIARVAWGIEKAPASDRKLSGYYSFVPKEGFDVVSCQFAIHYFFESKQKLENFVKNVATHMKTGAYFIGTCLDADKVRNALQAHSGILRKEKDNKVVWNIRQVSEDQVEIYMESIGRLMKENLVEFDILIAEFQKYGVILAQPITSFETEYNKMVKDETLDAQTKAKMTAMSDIEKEYSFLNSYFVFKKEDQT